MSLNLDVGDVCDCLQVGMISGVYSTAFCCVMTGMAVCCFAFKIRCPHVKRNYNVTVASICFLIPQQIPQWVSVTAASSTILGVICQAVQKFDSFMISVSVIVFFVIVTQVMALVLCLTFWGCSAPSRLRLSCVDYLPLNVLKAGLIGRHCLIKAQRISVGLVQMKILGARDQLVYFMSGSEDPQQLASVLSTFYKNEVNMTFCGDFTHG